MSTETAGSPGLFELSGALMWQEVRSRGARMFALPVMLSLVFVGITVVSVQSPQFLTGTTQGSLQQLVETQFGGVNEEYALTIALFVFQGPYLLATLSGVLGINVAQRMASGLVDSGRFELLLSAPFENRDVFLSLLLGTTLVTLLNVLVFASIAIVVPLVLLLVLGAEFGSSVNGVLLLAFLLPIPTSIWANLIMILSTMGVGGKLLSGVEDAFSLVGLLPGIGLLLLVNFFPRLNLTLLALGSIVAVVVLSLACSYWVTSRFDAVDILPS